jgi:hypothetical protein
MVTGAAGSHHDAVQVMRGDAVLDIFLSILGAGKQVGFDMENAGQGGGVFFQGRYVNAPGDISAAVADKDPDPGRIMGHVPFGVGRLLQG